MFISDPIFKRGTDGKIRQWNFIVEGNKWAVLSGLMGGTPTQSKWTTAKPKNVGKSNATTAEQQAMAEGVAKREEKLRSEYRANIADLDSVPRGPMLAATYAGNLDFAKGVWCQPKLDGIRALITSSGALTRSLQPHTNVGHIMKMLQPVFDMYPAMTIDGELYNHDHKDNFNKLIRMVRKVDLDADLKREVETTLQNHIYDAISPGSPTSEAIVQCFGERVRVLHTLEQLFKDHPIIKIVPTSQCGSQAFLDSMNGDYLTWGYEGQMIRLDTPYEWDTRSKGLLKRKEFITEEFQLLRIEEGEGNWSGMAKRIVFLLPDGRECGAGMRGDQEFAKELLHRRPVPSQVTIRYFNLTPDGVPRFPVATDFHNGRVD